MCDFSNNLFSFLLVLLKPSMSFNFHFRHNWESIKTKNRRDKYVFFGAIFTQVMPCRNLVKKLSKRPVLSLTGDPFNLDLTCFL